MIDLEAKRGDWNGWYLKQKGQDVTAGDVLWIEFSYYKNYSSGTKNKMIMSKFWIQESHVGLW